MLGGVKAVVSAVLQKREEKRFFDKIVNTDRNVSRFDLDKVYDARKYGFSLTESACYGLNEDNRSEYISTWEAYQPRRQENPFFILSDDKMLFSFFMENVVDTPCIYGRIVSGQVSSLCGAALTNDNLYDFFLQSHGGVLKDRNGYNGFGIHVYTSDGDCLHEVGELVTREEFAQTLSVSRDSLIQSRIEQGQFENGIYPNAVNTIRIISMRRKGSQEQKLLRPYRELARTAVRPWTIFLRAADRL